ncbi:MAG: hypothetical protein AB7W16_10645 [Candidatus Obscuribacterales bacterium]
MTKLSMLQLRKAIAREEFDHPMLASVLSPYQAVDQKINHLLKSGTILRVKKGLYVFGQDARQVPVCKESLANLIYGPSCISLEYALAFHGLIPESIEIVTSVTPKRDKDFSTPVGRFTYRYLSAAKYPHGIEQVWIDPLHPVLIASPEKALCDYVVLKDVPSFAGTGAARDFLLLDLRINEEDLPRFEARTLFKLNSHYKSKNIVRIMEAL